MKNRIQNQDLEKLFLIVKNNKEISEEKYLEFKTLIKKLSFINTQDLFKNNTLL